MLGFIVKCFYLDLRNRGAECRLSENIILEMEITQLMKLTENIKITQSEIIQNALIYSFDIFQAELNEFGKIGYESDNYPNLTEHIFSLPIKIIN